MTNNIISMCRGDTLEFDLSIYDENASDGRYILKDDDKVYFGLMDPNQPFENALVKKRYTVEDTDSMGNLTIVLDPEDTADLVPGTYYYSVKLHRVTNNTTEQVDKVITVIKKTKFVIYD